MTRFLFARAFVLVWCLSIGGCALIDALGGGAAIDYPEAGPFGPNFLDPSLTVATPGLHSFRAELGESATLRIKLSRVTGSGWTWGFNSPSEVGWDVSGTSGGTETFIASEGRRTPDLRFMPQAPAELNVEYFENGDSVPTFSKIVTVQLP